MPTALRREPGVHEVNARAFRESPIRPNRSAKRAQPDCVFRGMDTHEFDGVDPPPDQSAPKSRHVPRRVNASGEPKPRVDFATWIRTSRRFDVYAMAEEVHADDLADPSNLLRLARRQIELLFTEWALDTLRLYREMRPECAEGAALMAEALAKNPATMPDEAEVALRDALCRDPRRRVCLVELARLLSEADRLAEAMEFYLRAIDAGEDDEAVWFEAAKVMMRAGQAQRADKLLRDREDRIEDRALLVETLAECRRMIESRRSE